MSQVVVRPMQWTDVTDLHEVDALDQTDTECMKELASILNKFGKSDRFAVHLVHKHFDIADDEILCEFTDEVNRTLTTKPVKRDPSLKMVETTWLLRQEGEQVLQTCHMACYPVPGAMPPHSFRHTGQSSPG